MKWLRTFLTLGLLLAVLPAATLPSATLAAKDSPLCSAGATWVDMDDPERHAAALDRAALGAFDVNGDAQTCARPIADEREGNLRLAYKAFELDAPKELGALASCPDDSGPVDMSQPETVPFPLTSELLAAYDRNGDGRLCVTRSLVGAGDLTIEVSVSDMPVFAHVCGGRFATIIGTAGDDWIDGTPGDDVIVGLDGHDEINGRGGDDTICGGDGLHRVYGNEGGDSLGAYSSDNLLDGGPGDDILYMYGFNADTVTTTMYGGADNDYFEGYSSKELMHGGPAPATDAPPRNAVPAPTEVRAKPKAAALCERATPCAAPLVLPATVLA